MGRAGVTLAVGRETAFSVALRRTLGARVFLIVGVVGEMVGKDDVEVTGEGSEADAKEDIGLLAIVGVDGVCG